jgi:membrane protease YdiL (CAAX protease family)
MCLARKIATLIWAAILGFSIALIPQALWSALIVANLRTDARVPWAVAIMVLVLWLMWQYLGGRWAPRSTSEARRNSLRCSPISLRTFTWAVVAGALSIVALEGLWVVMARMVRMPGSVLPDMSNYPRLTVVAMVTMGALVSPICEQAGIWGYCQTRLEREYSVGFAVLITPLIFALLPHPPMHAALLPKLLFFFLIGLTFSLMVHLANSILPGLVVHAGGLLSFFVLVWPNDPARSLVTVNGTDVWFVMSLAQVAVFTALAAAAFMRISRIAANNRE